jgi:hypothetical protein
LLRFKRACVAQSLLIIENFLLPSLQIEASID